MEQTIDTAVEAFRSEIDKVVGGDICFPTSLDASRRVFQALENPDIGLASLAKILVAEPLLSARVIRLANSVAMNPAGLVVRDVRQAVLRLGMDPIKALAVAVVADQLRQAQRHSACRDIANRLWERSVHVAALSFVIAKKMTSLNPDEAMFAGIVHDLGRFYLLSKVSAFPALLEHRDVLSEAINEMATDATRSVLSALKLPDSVIEVVLASQSYGETMPPRTAGDLLYVARAVSPRHDPLEISTTGRPSPADEAVKKFDPAMVAEVIEASGNEIYSIVVALEV